MKHVAHPEKLYIQIADEGGKNMGISFCDEDPCEENSLDMNDFDSETLERILHIIGNAYMFINDRRQKLTKERSCAE